MDLIYCAAGNPRLVEIAHATGWQLGMRSDASPMIYAPIFVDIDYKKPNFEKHLEIVARYHPKYASVPDLSETEVSWRDALDKIAMAHILANYCEIPLIVPKLPGQIEMIPPDIAIGYSIPSSYGGAQYPLWELAGRRVHLLGGSPRKQMQAYLHLSAIATVLSADGNYAQLMATRYAQYWEHDSWPKHPGVANKEKDIYLDCWKRSCINLLAAWQKLTK